MNCFYCMNPESYSTTILVGHTEIEGEEDAFFEHLKEDGQGTMTGLLFGPTKVTSFRTFNEEDRREAPIEDLKHYADDPHAWLSMLTEGWSSLIGDSQAALKVMVPDVIGALHTEMEPQLCVHEALAP